MKVRIQSGRFKLPIYIPNRLIFNRWTIRLAAKNASIPPADMERLLCELQKLTSRREPWELVHVESASGEVISIVL